MNRYSLIFAVLFAASIGAHPPSAGRPDSSASGAGGEKKAVEAGLPKSRAVSPESFIQDFQTKGHLPQNAPLKILFATVPHPVETHLAAEFDHNVDALQDGLQDAGFLFDSSFIPWSAHSARDQFEDDEKERVSTQQQDMTPGILLFRRNGSPARAYAQGVLVFLITEKPTEGIAYGQIETALKILKSAEIPYQGPIRILGPTFSGSFVSLVPAVELLYARNPAAQILIRSGGVTAGGAANGTACELSRRFPAAQVDFGSVNHDYPAWVRAADHALGKMGIVHQHIAVLSEGESLFGGLFNSGIKSQKAGNPDLPGESGCDTLPADRWAGLQGMWSLAFPRDISSLRTNYEKQGLFSGTGGGQPWKRYLNLKMDDQGEGDSVRSFGADATVAAKESVLFGLSEFIKSHEIQGVIISATNEEDRYFLTQFLHANNSGTRVAVIGNTRMFMRGSTAQFRGDMMVDNFPMLPHLHEWTADKGDGAARVFEDDVAQGTYIAAADLFVDESERLKWVPEYSEPAWLQNSSNATHHPPMYVTAIGVSDAWPISENETVPLFLNGHEKYQVAMPFNLFAHASEEKRAEVELPQPQPPIVARYWRFLFLLISLLTLFYCGCIWYAKPVNRINFATLEPTREWRYWLFKVAMPAIVAGCGFVVLAWAVELPAAVSPSAVKWWHWAEAMSFLCPLAISMAAAQKALRSVKLPFSLEMLASFAPAGLALLGLLVSRFYSPDPFAGRSVGESLNTLREMHWESGLSLLPTCMLFLLATLVWGTQAGNGAAELAAAPRLPDIPGNRRISQERADAIACIARPLPTGQEARWLWAMWFAIVAVICLLHFYYRPFLEITTLESGATTCWIRAWVGAIAALVFLDVLQFLHLWEALHGLLRALDAQSFKRSFVPIRDFNWRSLWSMTGTSLRDRRAILGAQIQCALALRKQEGFEQFVRPLLKLLHEYDVVELNTNSDIYRRDLDRLHRLLADAGSAAAALLRKDDPETEQPAISADAEAIRRALMCSCQANGGRFSDETEELARVPDWRQSAERLVCLLYIGFIQMGVARLHTLLVSQALMFSLVAFGIAIYPFAPASPLLLASIGLLGLIGWAFFKVFKEMDTDPILARIVNGDDRKLQGSFYTKFAEAIALPLLTLGSSLLPGGAGRLLELAQTMFNHGQ